jgi:phage terminase small subunit
MQVEAVVDAKGVPTGQYVYNGNVANKALELLGKAQGMFVDRKEIGGAGAFDHLDDDELSKTIEALAEEVQEIEQALLPPPAEGAQSCR